MQCIFILYFSSIFLIIGDFLKNWSMAHMAQILPRFHKTVLFFVSYRTFLISRQDLGHLGHFLYLALLCFLPLLQSFYYYVFFFSKKRNPKNKFRFQKAKDNGGYGCVKVENDFKLYGYELIE